MYKVEKIIDKRITNDKEEYKIKWKGFSIKDCTWEPLDNLANLEDLICEFNQTFYKNINKKNENIIRDQKEKKISSISLPIDDEGETRNIVDKPTQIKRKRGRPKKTFLQTINSSCEGSKLKNRKNFSEISDSETKGTNNVSEDPEMERISPSQEMDNKYETASPDENKNIIVAYEIPKKILSAKINQNDEICFLVEWNKRSDGTTPQESYVTNESMRTYFPQLLIDYYQSKVVKQK